MTAFQEIYEEYGSSVYRFLFALSGDADLAEELLQETFYRAFRHADRFRGQCSMYAWLCQIGKNAWIDEVRRRKRFNAQAIEDLLSEYPSPTLMPEEAIILQDEYARARTAVLKLEKPYRDVLILHVYGELKLKEIANAYGKTESWARVTLYRAKQQIKKEVKNHE